MRFLILFFCLLSSPAFAGATAYFSALSDLPVAPGLIEESGSAVTFDQPEGRIIVLQATGTVQDVEIKDFYNKALPALGWQVLGPGQYAREKEVMLLGTKPEGAGHNRLNILVRPR